MILAFACNPILVNYIFLIAFSDGVIHEWDIATGACVRMLKGHCRPLTALWVSQTQQYLLVRALFMHVGWKL